MKKQIFIAFIILIAGTFASVFAQQSENLSDIGWVEKATDALVEDHEIPAVVVAVIKDGKIEKIINRGVLKRVEAEKVDENTLFQIGSLTKSFTGIIAKNLIKERKIEPNASITKYLPETLSPQTKAKLEPITIENVLFHRSGIPRDSKIVKRFGNDPMVCCYTEKDLLDDLEILELEFKPDEKAMYSNLAYGLLGYIFERATGKTYEELLQTYVAKKYGLENTTTKPSETQKVATPYRKENRYYETKPFEMGKVVSAGGIFSTVADLSKLMTLQIKAHRDYAADKTDGFLFLAKETKPFFRQMKYGYGIFENGDNYGHGGDVDGFASAYTFVPKKNIGLIILTSSGGGWMGKFEDVIFKKISGDAVEMPAVRKTISVSKEKLDRYTGKYEFTDEKQVFTIVQNGEKLEAYIQGTFGPRELYFKSEHKLFAKTINLEFEFEFDERGNFSKITGRFNGREISIKKAE